MEPNESDSTPIASDRREHLHYIYHADSLLTSELGKVRGRFAFVLGRSRSSGLRNH